MEKQPPPPLPLKTEQTPLIKNAAGVDTYQITPKDVRNLEGGGDGDKELSFAGRTTLEMTAEDCLQIDFKAMQLSSSALTIPQDNSPTDPSLTTFTVTIPKIGGGKFILKGVSPQSYGNFIDGSNDFFYLNNVNDQKVRIYRNNNLGLKLLPENMLNNTDQIPNFNPNILVKASFIEN